MTKETTHARVEVKASGPAGTSSASDTPEDATAATRGLFPTTSPGARSGVGATSRVSGLCCPWCFDGTTKRPATDEDWEWLRKQGEAFGMGFQSRYSQVCWAHDVCGECGGRGEFWFESEVGAADKRDCGDCNGDGLIHRHCGLPAGLCECEEDE